MNYLTIARDLVRNRFPGARAAFLAGSILTDRRTPTSDLDIVVLLTGPPAPFRESLVHEGRPVELFVQTEADWRGFAARESAERKSPLLAMCADGVLLADADGLGAALQAEPRERLAAGPPAVPAAELEDRRYELTDALDDFRGCADPLERTYLVADLLRRASELALLAGGHWLGGGKWLSRRLAEAEPGLHSRLTGGATEAITGTPEGADVFMNAVGEALALAGGPLWAGYQRGWGDGVRGPGRRTRPLPPDAGFPPAGRPVPTGRPRRRSWGTRNPGGSEAFRKRQTAVGGSGSGPLLGE
ncbi:nucleotidyltransferase domain-containing protein [Streptomyces sp. MMG1121]|uniref:nucleotidyltransferase domain-containing protein n=1 Tax=Streptomyces sp. MMG1121 TaxID=1415544 RepID=UPI0007C77F5D|nr:nucleotidyltransferase domain-containing protein [Streptomyces sp. MMG1121]